MTVLKKILLKSIIKLIKKWKSVIVIGASVIDNDI